MPTLPAAPTVTTQVPIGTLGPTPTTTRVVPGATEVADVLSTLTDENVNMDAPPDPPSDTVILWRTRRWQHRAVLRGRSIILIYLLPSLKTCRGTVE